MDNETILSGLLQGAIENPMDDLTWYAIADFMDDTGHHDRAELVRIGQKLHEMGCKDLYERSGLEARQSELLLGGVKPVVPEYVNGIGMRFVLVRPGVFRMGKPRDQQSGDSWIDDSHEKRIAEPFWLGVFPMTIGERSLVLWNGPRGNTHPAVGLSRESANEIIDKIRLLEHSPNGYHLPTEAQWEYACRAGTTTPYAWQQTDLQKVMSCNGKKMESVGSYSPNAFGIYDMHGLVWEWCSDWYDNDEGGSSGPAGRLGVLRGGSRSASSYYCRSNWKRAESIHQKSSEYGMRVVRAWQG